MQHDSRQVGLVCKGAGFYLFNRFGNDVFAYFIRRIEQQTSYVTVVKYTFDGLVVRVAVFNVDGF